MDRTLVLFPGALGDFLCLWPALQGLRETVAGRITLAVRTELFDLLASDEFDRVSIDARAIADLFANRPLDAATERLFAGHARVHSFIGTGDDWFATRLASATGGRVLLHRVRGMRSGEHATQYFARCLAVVASARALVPTAADTAWCESAWREHDLGECALAIHPGSGGSRKNWLGMNEIAARWRERPGARVVLLAGPAESDRRDLPDCDLLLRDAPLSRVAAVVRRAHRYLGNDSGITHLAGLAGALGVALFGPTDAATWRPNGAGLRVLVADRECRDCGEEVFCTHRLAIEDVWPALDRADR